MTDIARQLRGWAKWMAGQKGRRGLGLTVKVHSNRIDSQHYERIFERNGQKVCRVYRVAAILPNYTQFAAEAVDHPTQKPIKLITDLVSKTRGMVLDPFMGSGTTGVACARLGRPFVGVEIEPKFFDIACDRIRAAYAQQRLFA